MYIFKTTSSYYNIVVGINTYRVNSDRSISSILRSRLKDNYR